ncbi:hypothetical protein [Phytoactinopolyspora halotolerans]|uniref:Uncharacterized protein n=1 Tax=Phytoactinopolyspora halotolerans TaxID=1981512 RepID=A0A6L9S7F2_9ACTN|nr:hypothetical protein [Phytoactinopolyspora halotolerans]NEE00907.1 hypothetical protein [Phytoactinopolyspora halotolerans]
MTRDGGFRRFVRASAHLPVTVWGGLLLVAALSAGVAAGELAPGMSAGVESELAVGEQIDTGPYRVTIDRARVLDELPGISEGDESTRVIAVVAVVSGNGSTTLGGAMLADTAHLRGVPGVGDGPGDGLDHGGDLGVAAQGVFVIADGSRLDALQPGIEYEVAMAWEQSAEAAPPTELEVALVGRTLRESSIDRSKAWLDRSTMAVGRIPVTPPDGNADGASG